MKYGSLSRSFGKLVASSLNNSNNGGATSPTSSSPGSAKKEGPSQLFKSKSVVKKKLLSDEHVPGLSNGLRKLSGNRHISPDLVNWINTLELKGKEPESPASPAITAPPASSAAPRIPDSPTTPSTPTDDSLPFPRRRGSIKPRLPGELAPQLNPNAGKLYLRIVEMRHKLKGPRGKPFFLFVLLFVCCCCFLSPAFSSLFLILVEDKAFVVVATVKKCSLATVPVEFCPSVSFEEGFLL